MKPDDPEIEEWLVKVNEAIKKDMLPKMRSSAFVIAPVEEDLDAYMLMQVGAALLLEKPLILIAVKGAWIPKKARELADAVVEVESLKNPEEQARLHAVISKVVEKVRKERQQQ